MPPAIASSEALERARAQYPRVQFTAVEIPAEVSSEHLVDYLLCRAAIAEDTVAQEHVADLARDAFAHLRRRPAFAAREDEVVQKALIHLFGVGEDEARLAQYTGRGALGSWLRVVITRLALNAVRDEGAVQRASTAMESDEQWPALAGDPEITLLRHQHRAVFKRALAAALGSLSARERLLLKLRFSEQLQIAQIAQLLDAHRVTVSGLLRDARLALTVALDQELRREGCFVERDLDNFSDWLGSQPDLSLSRLFSRVR